VNVLVSDAKGIPVAGATVEVSTEYPSFGSSRTDGEGRATVHFPAGRKVYQIIALKSGVGFDYFENYQSWPSQGNIEVPDTVSLVLDGAQTGRIKAIDSSGKDIVGAEFYLTTVKKIGKLSYANVPGSRLVSRTDARGVALFDWLPINLEEPLGVLLWPGVWHAPARPMLPIGHLHDAPPVRLVSKAILRGKVLRPDGTPAAGILVEAGGVGKDMLDDYDGGSARTAVDGTYAIALAPDHSYMVGVWDNSWAARSLTNIVPRREGEVHDLPDLRLIKGTVVQGRLTRGPDKQPAVGQWLSLEEDGDPLSSDYKLESRESLTRVGRTDKDGRYSWRVGPGEYRLHVISGRSDPLKVGSEQSITREYLVTEKENASEHRIEGMVREKSGDGAKSVANAFVWGVSLSENGPQFVARTSAGGKFDISSRNDDLVFYARNHDGSRAGFAELKKGQRSVIVDLDVASSVSGRVVDQDARPCVGQRVQLRVQPGIKHRLSGMFFLQSTTDGDGRYRLSGLVPGSWCVLTVDHPVRLPGSIDQQSFQVGPDPTSQPDIILPVSLHNDRVNEKPEPDASRPPTVPSGPSRSEIADLIRAIGRDPVSHDLVDRIAATYHPRFLWALDFARMKQLATDPKAMKQLDAIAKEVQGKPLDTSTLLRLAMRYHAGYDDAMMKQLLREWFAKEKLPSVTIRGTVVDEANQQPIPFPRIFADDAIAPADEHGRFELKVRKKAGASRGISLWVEADGHASGEFVVKQNEDLRIALRRDVPFFGKVVDHEGKPVEGAEVRARMHRALILLGDTKPEEFRGGSHGVFQVRTDREGRFSFQGVPDSDFTAAQAGLLEDEILRNLARDHELNNPRWPFLIKARNVEGKTLIDATFSKRVKGKDNTNKFSTIIQAKRAEFHFDLAKKIVQLELEDAELQNYGRADDVATIHHNMLEIPLPEDPRFMPKELPIDLEVTHPRFQTSNTSASAPTHADKAPLIRMEPGAGITVQVFDDRDKPVVDAVVQVRDDSGRYLATAFTDRESGMCHTPAILKPGRYTVVVQSAPFAPAWRTIVVGEVLSAHQFVLEPGGYIRGKVVSENDKPVAGATVGWPLHVPTERRLPGQHVLELVTTTDADGQFVLGPLPPGKFQIKAIAESPHRQGRTFATVNQTTVIKVSPDR